MGRPINNAGPPEEHDSGTAEHQPQRMQGLIEGRIVHYVHAETKTEHWTNTSGDAAVELPDPRAGQHEAALVVGVFDYAENPCNLFVFQRDGEAYLRHHVPYSEGKEPGTWHWIERA